MKKLQGKPLPLGVTEMKDGVNFAVEVPEGKECELLLYRKGEEEPEICCGMERTAGAVYTLKLTEINFAEYEYNYRIGGEVYPDPYVRAFSGREIWLQKRDVAKHEIRGKIYTGDYDWQGDRPLNLPYHQVISYALHVRGFTQDASSKVKNKGTFLGVAEKIPYMQELGINQIQCMPVYEFEESGRYTNYWGYGKAYYFAPKSAYAACGDGVKELKDLVKKCHKAGIEVVLEMPFAEDITMLMAIECLRYYVLDYHVDGFILNPYALPFDDICNDPILKKTKIMKHEEGFQNTMRRFLKGDEGMVPGVMHWLRKHSEKERIFNYMTGHTGFTLNDLVSYDGKHNELNGENNQDGPEYNYSWNCGAEGPTRKKAIAELRMHQMRNAFFLLLTAQGTPCLLAGDEFGNSQKGNNNVYCQDNPTGWVNWKNGAREREMKKFVKGLIALRKACPALGPEKEMLGIDRTGCGVPDVSYHGEEAWQAPSEVSSRQLGVYYSKTAPLEDECFVAYNMHWLAHTFAIPALRKGKKWHLAASTGDGICEEMTELEEQRSIDLPPRTIVLLIGR